MHIMYHVCNNKYLSFLLAKKSVKYRKEQKRIVRRTTKTIYNKVELHHASVPGSHALGPLFLTKLTPLLNSRVLSAPDTGSFPSNER